MTDELPAGTCLSCLGSGEISSERGLARCEDCDGTGHLGSLFRRTEARVRQIEARLARLDAEVSHDLSWLIDELRRHRQVLVKVMTAAQDGSDEPLLRQIQFDANEVLGVYDVVDG